MEGKALLYGCYSSSWIGCFDFYMVVQFKTEKLIADLDANCFDCYSDFEYEMCFLKRFHFICSKEELDLLFFQID